MLTADQKHAINKVVPQIIADLPKGYVAETAHDEIRDAIGRAIGHPGVKAKVADISFEYGCPSAKSEIIRVKAGLKPARYYQIMAS